MAMVLHALALAAIAALLLFGCVSEPKPESGMQGIIVQSAEGLIGEVQAPKAVALPAPNASGQPPAPEQKINCTLAVEQPVVVLGERVDITLNSRFTGSARFDLICGNESRNLITENSLALETSCLFGSPGEQMIYVMANGRECARAAVEVRKKAGGNCSIDSKSIERDLASYHYKWKVDFDGFSDGDVLAWACGNTISKKKLSSDPIWGMPRFEVLSCDYPGRPADDYISVSISGVQCGQVSTR